MPNHLMGYESDTSGDQKQVTTTNLFGKTGLDVALTANVAGKSLPQVDVNVQDQTSPDINLYMHQELNDGNLLAAPTVIDSRDVTLTAGHGALVGNSVCFREGSHFTQGIVTVVNVNTITLDSLMDKVYTTAADVCIGNINMNVDGSVTPIIFKIGPLPASGDSWDIVRMQGHILDNVDMDDAKFGGVTGLTNGILFRRTDGYSKNLFNAKSNGDLSLICTDSNYSDKAPAGFYGFNFKKGWGGQENSGVVQRLISSSGDELQCIIQDDLTDLENFNIIIQGHVVE